MTLSNHVCAYTYLIGPIVESVLERSYNVSIYIVPLPHFRHSSCSGLCRPLSFHGIFTVRPMCWTSDNMMDSSSIMIHITREIQNINQIHFSD